MATINRDAKKEAQLIINLEEETEKIAKAIKNIKSAMEDCTLDSAQRKRFEGSMEQINELLNKVNRLNSDEISVIKKKRSELIRDEGEDIFAGVKAKIDSVSTPKSILRL